MRLVFMLVFAAILGCGPSFEPRSVQGLHSADASDFWGLPLPSDLRQKPDGSYGLLDWPVAQPSELVSLWLAAADAELRHGWGVNSGMFVPALGCDRSVDAARRSGGELGCRCHGVPDGH